ncbi:hypothetical protein [Deinococcus cellulosilyticus]
MSTPLHEKTQSTTLLNWAANDKAETKSILHLPLFLSGDGFE